MRRHPFISLVIALPLGVLTAGCSSKSTVPEAQQTSGVQPRSDATTVSGCLRAGDAADTFVLNSKAEDSAKATTYQLKANDRVNLRDYLGQQVEVSGTVRAEQEVTSSSGTTPAKAAKGTSGTPTVETKTDLDVRQLDVTSVRPTGSKCE
jgi:hypothetical protein